jgi:hypothetical protein
MNCCGVQTHDALPFPVNTSLWPWYGRSFDNPGATQTPRYKARPLNGIWASAPYLHNGSVPTLWDLLNPAKERRAVFYIGSHDFDPEKVGLVTNKVPGSFRFDAAPQGNWSNGHEFGTSLSPDEKTSLLEFLKTL